MAPATLTVPTYPHGTRFEGSVDLENHSTSLSVTLTEFLDELSQYSDEARASILRGLKQTETQSLGSFAKYAKD